MHKSNTMVVRRALAAAACALMLSIWATPAWAEEVPAAGVEADIADANAAVAEDAEVVEAEVPAVEEGTLEPDRLADEDPAAQEEAAEDHAEEESSNTEEVDASETETADDASQELEASAPIDVSHVTYEAHVQSKGWMSEARDGALAGTTGISKRVEGLKIRLLDADGNQVKGVSYKVYVETGGWQDWVSDGALAGTTGKSQRIEAIKIKLSDELSALYDIIYRTHVQSFGWFDWAGNGNASGSMGYAKRIEALEIKLRKKSDALYGSGQPAVKSNPGVYLSGHVQSYGWQPMTIGSAGTTGKGKRLEALKAQIATLDETSGSIEYIADVAATGKGSAVKDGAVAGTTGKAQAAEGFLFRLTGDLKDKYDIYYRGHSQTFGWLNWASNGQTFVGSDGFGKRLEAIEVRLVPKGQAAPASNSSWSAPYIAPVSVEYNTSADGSSWQYAVKDGANSGNTSGNLLDKVSAKLIIPSYTVGGGITYSVHAKDGAWLEGASNGGAAGTAGKDIDTLRMSLNGELAKVYDIYYSSHVAGKGWLAWAANGQNSGTQKTGTGIDAVRVKLVPKGQQTPAADPSSYKFLETYYETQTTRNKTIDK